MTAVDIAANPHGQQGGFQTGSRYGRTDPDAAMGPDDRLQRRFYANGRYGKRASSATLAEYQLLDGEFSYDSPREPRGGENYRNDSSLVDAYIPDFASVPYVVDDDSQVACRYTGVANLFRCARR